MSAYKITEHKCDMVVVGAGGAGLRATSNQHVAPHDGGDDQAADHRQPAVADEGGLGETDREILHDGADAVAQVVGEAPRPCKQEHHAEPRTGRGQHAIPMLRPEHQREQGCGNEERAEGQEQAGGAVQDRRDHLDLPAVDLQMG